MFNWIRQRNQRSNCQHPLDQKKKKARNFQENIYFCFINYAKTFDCVNHKNLWKNLKKMGIPSHITYLLRNLFAGQETKSEPDMEQWTGSKLGKECVKAVYCHPAYLTSMQSTLCKCCAG